LRKTAISFVRSVHRSVGLSARNNSVPTEWFFVNFYIWVFFENLSRKFKFYLNLTRITGALHEGQHTCVIISRSILLTMRNISDEKCREHNKNTRFNLIITFLGSFEKLQKVTISFVMAVRPHGKTRLPLDRFS